MKFRAFLQNKLWRDRSVIRMEEAGSTIHWKRLDDCDYDMQLREKLIEEAYEVHAASSRQELIEELADVLEIIDSMCSAHCVSPDEVRTIQRKKRADRGGFEGRTFVTIAVHPEGSFGEKYCLADPVRYPEVNAAEYLPHNS